MSILSAFALQPLPPSQEKKEKRGRGKHRFLAALWAYDRHPISGALILIRSRRVPSSRSGTGSVRLSAAPSIPPYDTHIILVTLPKSLV